MFTDINWQRFFIGLIVTVLSIALHEFGHAISADYLGDPGPRRDGRVTLWPDKHFDPLGFIMIVFTNLFGFGIGWGKPVMVNTRYFKHPRRDLFIVSAFGPLMNLLLAVVFGVVIRIAVAAKAGDSDWIDTTVTGQFLLIFVTRNLALMFFNLLPMHPLDGGKLFSSLLPVHQAIQFDRFMGQWGPMILLLLVFSGTGFLSHLILPAVQTCANLFTGLHLVFG